MTRVFRLASAVVAVALAGCATSPATYASGSGYVASGVVVQVRPVAIERQGSNAGTWVGGAVGTAAGYALTRHADGSARVLGSVLGAAAGGAAGQAIASRKTPGVLVIVRESGRLVSVVQPATVAPALTVGETVFVVRDGAATRVVEARQ
jgi:outer membrane lipoprotein SlyB